MARRLVLIAIGFCTCLGAHAQTTSYCATSRKLICLLPFATNALNGANAASIDASGKASSFNGPIAAQLSQLPAATSAPAATVIFSKGNPEPFSNLGPILLDRPDSVGTGTLVVGFSFQHFNFNHLDGIDAGSIPFTFQQVGPSTVYPVQYFSQKEQVSLQFNQYIALATFGLPHKTDVSVVVPFGQVTINATSFSPTTYLITTGNALGPQNPGQSGNPVPGSANGLGDITLSVKHVLWSGGESGRGSLATGAALRLPTGDAYNYLGSGAYGFNVYALASYKYWISPHAKLAYQFNTSTTLLNVDKTPGADRPLPGGAQFSLGADVNVPKLHNRLTAAVDMLANEFVNSPYVQQTTICIPSSSATACGTKGTAGVDYVNLSDVTRITKTYTSANMSFGLKVTPIQNLIVYGNVLVQVNDVGLRADPSPSFGISYSFRGKLSGKNLHKALDR